MLTIILVIGVNLGLIFFLMAAPLGIRPVRRSLVIHAPRERVWGAVFPLGVDAGWSNDIVSVIDEGEGGARLIYSSPGRDDAPIERRVKFDRLIENRSYAARIVDDTSLDQAFWANYREEVRLEDVDGGVRVEISRSDRYRGFAFLAFRYFALRRELSKLKRWAETGEYRPGGVFEHPATQFGMAGISVFLLWPVFGLNATGFGFAIALTVVVALHELGHMAAFRLMGHRKVRMIFVPILGGIAIGGRPYDRSFEVAFVAMMGAGFSAFMVGGLVLLGDAASVGQNAPLAVGCTILGGFGALFNLANLVPVWKFDGGQALRQIVKGPPAQAIASFLLLAAFLLIGHKAGIPGNILVAIGAVFAILSVITAGKAVRPRFAMKPMLTSERYAMGAAFIAIFAIHGYGVLWAIERST